MMTDLALHVELANSERRCTDDACLHLISVMSKQQLTLQLSIRFLGPAMSQSYCYICRRIPEVMLPLQYLTKPLRASTTLFTVASLEDEIEIIASQLMADLGVDVATSTVPHEGNVSESQAWCSNMELQPPAGTDQDEICQGCFSSDVIETIFQPLNQDPYLLEELINQDYHDLHPQWSTLN
ncbi:hypothetical protein Salat_0933000 [Sesamum alatum]|uniref:Uncharacterized protein n=1 Tax=Sesamum alatum TaxID=300844 RepID=A0AAE1YKJ9_9LAMI|nr:hypothetical protein Salat_0933000 [Sesamum alatum]